MSASNLLNNKTVVTDFEVTDEFLKKAGLPRIDQEFLDDFERRQPWNTARFKFFNFIRCWCMTIFALICPCPALLSLQLSTTEGQMFYGLGALLVFIFAILLDRIFVPKSPDQQLSVQDFYAFFYDEQFHEKEAALEIKRRKFGKVLLKLLLYSIVFIITVGTINFTAGFNPLFGDIVAWLLTVLTAWWVLYKCPYDFNTHLSVHKYWRPKISEFLKYNVAAGNYGLIFLVPYFIGPLIYLIVLPIFVWLSFKFYQIEPGKIDGFFYTLKPIMIYVGLIIPIFHLFFSTTTTVGMKYICFAKEILKFNLNKG